MKRAIKIIFKIFKIVLLITLIFVAIYVGMCSYNVDIDNSFTLNKGSFAVNPTWRTDSYDTPIDEIYSRYDGTNDAEIVYDIYLYVCKKFMLMPTYGSRAKSVIKAWVGEDYDSAAISVDVTNNTSHQYKTVGTPELNANQLVEHSYTNSIYVTECNQDSLEGVLKSVIQFGDRGYSCGEEAYKQKGKLSVMEDGDEVFNWDTEYAEDNARAKRTYEDGDIRDIDNFIVDDTTILGETCEIFRDFDENYGMYKYRIKFSLDCSESGEGCATYYEVSAIKDLLGDFCKDIVYDQLDIELNMYSNGYLLSRSLIQNWTITVNLFNLQGHAKSELNEVYNYRDVECRIVNFTK